MTAHRILHDSFRAPFLMTDPGDAGSIIVDRDRAEVPIVTAGAETRTLAQPTKAGLMCKLVIDTYVGDLTLTVTGGYNQAATTSITMGTAGDWVLFTSVKVGASYYWRVVQHEGTNITDTGGGTITSQTITSLTSTNANATTVIATTVNATSATVTNANATLGLITTVNGTSATFTNANATLGLITTVNGTSSTFTNANATLGILGTMNATNATITTATLTNATAGRLQITSAAVTAAGSDITNAANLSYGMNVVSATDNTKGVILPVAVANGCVEILQTVNNASLLIYPQVNSTIAGLSANAALNSGTSNTAATAGTTQNVYLKFVATNTTQWYASK